MKKIGLYKINFYALTCAGLLGCTTGAQAAGFALQENSVSGLGAAFAGSSSSINDASTVWFNTAGMTYLDRAQANVGVQLIMPTSHLRDNGSTLFGGPIAGNDGGNPYKPTPLPNINIAAPLNDRTWAGFSFNTPFGLANDYENTSFIRYDSTYTSLQVYNAAANLAYKISPMLSIGGGLDLQYANATLRNAVNGGALNDAYSQLTGDSLDVGYHLAVKANPPLGRKSARLTVRASITSLEGDISVIGTSGIVTPFTSGGTAELKLPDIAAIGVTQEITPRLRGMANVTWFNWSKFEDITAILDNGTVATSVPQNYKDTVAFAVGAEYDLNDAWTVRGGYQFDPTPTRDNFRTSRTPDGDRNWVTAGASYKLSENVSLDFGAAYIHIGEEDINLTRNGATVVYDATSTGHVEIVSAALNYKF